MAAVSTSSTGYQAANGYDGSTYSHDSTTPPLPHSATFSTHSERESLGKAQGDSDATAYRSTGLLSPKLSADRVGAAKTNKRVDLADGADDSKWIHRDKLAKIESQELQAAGIYLPKVRNQRNSGKRDASQNSSRRSGTRTRTGSESAAEPRTPDTAAWDLRLPEEIEEANENSHWMSVGQQGVSRIPIAKISPAPIPMEQLERDTLLARRHDHSPDEDGQTLPRVRTRSTSNLKSPNSQNELSAKRIVTEGSPQKQAPRKASLPDKRTAMGNGRPVTRGRDPTAPRTPIRSVKDMQNSEGDPPWVVKDLTRDSTFPLDQEQWEREGSSGRDMRTLNSIDLSIHPAHPDRVKVSRHGQEDDEEWPLKGDDKKSPTSPVRAGSYSTMPKITDKPPVSPLASPLGQITTQEAPRPPQRVPEPDEKQEAKSKGCGCCVMM